MKKLLLLPLALAFASNAAVAANSVDLNVSGTITPAACDISLDGGDIDLGSIQTSSLNESTSTYLGESARKTLSVTCSGATLVGIKFIDNRQDSSGSNQGRFGLGFDVDGNPIGSYGIQFASSSMTADGIGTKLKRSDDDGLTWQADSAVAPHVAPYGKMSRMFAMDTNSTSNAPLVPISSFGGRILAETSINPKNSLNTSDDITLDGSATIELVYL